jgi:hypothetical protein
MRIKEQCPPMALIGSIALLMRGLKLGGKRTLDHSRLPTSFGRASSCHPERCARRWPVRRYGVKLCSTARRASCERLTLCSRCQTSSSKLLGRLSSTALSFRSASACDLLVCNYTSRGRQLTMARDCLSAASISRFQCGPPVSVDAQPTLSSG